MGLFQKYHPLVMIQRYWLFLMLVALPFSIKYLIESPAAISMINVFSVGFIILGLGNLLIKTIPYTAIRDKGMLAVVGLLMVAMAFALLFTDPLRNGVGLWTSRLLQPVLVGFFVYQMLSAKVVKVSEIVQVLFYSLVPLLVGGVLQALRVIPPGEDPHRITVLYEYPNTFARYVEILLLVSLPWVLFRSKKIHTGELIVWGLGVLLLLATTSYNGVATCMIGLAVMALLFDKRFTKLKWRSLLTMAALVVVVGLNAHHLPKWEVSVTDSVSSRLQFWSIARHVIHDNFWTGVGIKGWETHYIDYVFKYGPVPPMNWVSYQPHDIFLDSLLKAGPLGLIAVVLLLLWPVWRGLQVNRFFNLEHGGWFGLSMVGYGLAMFLFGIIDDPLWSDDVTPLLYIFFACLAWMYVNRNNPKEVSNPL